MRCEKFKFGNFQHSSTMNRGFIRTLSHSSSLSKSHWRSCINSFEPKLTIPQLKTAKPESVIVLSTTNLLPQIIKESISLYDENIQVVVAGVDTIKGSRMGVSELWMDKRMKILKSSPLSQDQNEPQPPNDVDGINVVQVKDKNWKSIESDLTIQFRNGSEKGHVKFPLANSLFTTEQLVTLFLLDPSQTDPHDKPLSKLSLELTSDIFNPGTSTNVSEQDLWVPLTNEPMYITNCVGNLIKSLNNRSAAKILENNEKLLAFNSKETKVYIKIYHKADSTGFDTNFTSYNKHEIIAGGGGWGAKADTIVVAPPAKLSKGDRVELFMLPPRKYQPQKSNSFDCEGFEFECSPPEESYELEFGEQCHFNQFSCGSEQGFEFNDVNYKSSGEKLIICK